MAKSWQCESCGTSISELGAYAKLTSSRYMHLSCYENVIATEARQAGREQVLEEQAAKVKAEREALEARRQAEQEAVKIKKLAEENARLERERVKTLTVQAQEQIKREQAGESRERFSLIEIDPEDAVRIAEERRAQADALKERQASDAEALKKLVVPDAQVKEKADEGREAVKRGVRPLEIE